ncbi:uncharacterized protein LOC134223827 [Armigeres subalbatus]|uniref:uncharacterized protein LOC134223827 n=1 Tax=Armigeres subalbatus TaxID=124917 RepID=UPI002ED5CD3E
MAPPIAATTAVACIPGNASALVEVIGSSSTVSPAVVGGGPSLQSKNCHFNADTIKLIDCVQARPALWHRKHLRQRVQVAHRGWEEIRKAFKANDVSSLKVRWKTLRDSFRREVKRMEDGEIATSSWPLYERMSFLLGHFRTRESFLKSGATSPNQSKSDEHWNYASDTKHDSQTETDEPMTHNAGSSAVESEPEVMQSYTVVYTDPKPPTYEIIPQPLSSNVETAAAVMESDADDHTMIETYETVQTEEFVHENDKMDAGSSQDVIEVSEHMYGEVTFKNKLRARIKTEPVDADQQRRVHERSYGEPLEMDSDYNFLMSLHPFMKKLPNRKNLSVRIKIQQLIAEAMDES